MIWRACPRRSVSTVTHFTPVHEGPGESFADEMLRRSLPAGCMLGDAQVLGSQASNWYEVHAMLVGWLVVWAAVS